MICATDGQSRQDQGQSRMRNKEKRRNEARKQPEKQSEREKSSKKGRDKSVSSERQVKSAGKREPGEKDRIKQQKYASDMIETISFRQESVYVQLLLLIILLNAVVGDEPLEAYALYHAVCYSMLALVYGLQLLAKFSSQPPSLASNKLVLGDKRLLMDVDRLQDKKLRELLQLPEKLEFP